MQAFSSVVAINVTLWGRYFVGSALYKRSRMVHCFCPVFIRKKQTTYVFPRFTIREVTKL